MLKEIFFKRINGDLQKAKVWCILHDDIFGVTWMEKEKCYIKFITTKSKQDIFDFIFQIDCQNNASFCNAFFETLLDFGHYVSSFIGRIINSFMSSTFSGLGMMDFFKLMTGLVTILASLNL
ncbi:hypothetical protein BpHYR1_032143 [Brachionus plicatilis]|uniref:Uncharacterized protein n=1 Tax=Brachionus plicatilis TaxID=10195 RepID=A0A3M7QZV4_BRAPC|nr:hypothetical protein BpHYR1_032143 [Brachionus plicatilis]